ncbi:uncharacterized protein CTRU02_201100 [Colletotrichum truncatum]|uniref:Uncharacterized protein n=1 Tax=Colletotrichum truncatum TaxID=5467 RepID=A0ACC3ZGC8_COLTU|nr:uncharacterized protein CTRU02_12414 [Colletotrichum truncatum]KAF6784709.1 hypothetical protein CTRU02_12414 [Colletotrichum truncatum]
MTSVYTILGVFAAAAVAVNVKHARTESIEWGPCADWFTGPVPIQCGNITVPLDYADPDSTETLEIELLKVPALKGPSKGSILFNFGGPGGPARGSLATRGYLLQAATGGNHDLIGWDPRGTGNTTTFTCFSTEEEQAIYSAALPKTLGNNSNPASVARAWAGMGVIADYCYEKPESNKTGSLISTAYTARDMMKIVDAVEEDGLLRYWGTSYGTVLGATVAAMFPDRVGRVLLDSAANPHEWYSGFNIEWLLSADETLTAFFQTCLDAPNCVLAKGNETAQSLSEQFWSYLGQRQLRPIAVGPSVIDQSTIASTVRPALYDPTRWPLLSVWLHGLYTGNATLFGEAALALLERTPSLHTEGNGDQSPWGIQCADKGPRINDLDDFLPIVDEIDEASRTVGNIMWNIEAACSQWKIKPRERYEGGFNNIKTKNPLLVFSHSLDPATSIVGAKNATAGFEGSVLLQTDGYGHGWRAHPSVCATKAIQKYFDEGVLPEPGTVCKTDVVPFQNFTDTDEAWKALLPQIGFDSNP